MLDVKQTKLEDRSLSTDSVGRRHSGHRGFLGSVLGRGVIGDSGAVGGGPSSYGKQRG